MTYAITLFNIMTDDLSELYVEADCVDDAIDLSIVYAKDLYPEGEFLLRMFREC